MISTGMRPRDFSQVVGQNSVTISLRLLVEDDKIPQAILFCGPKGTGKTSVARILSRAMVCASLNKGNPCNECDGCLDPSSVIEIDAASHNGVDYIRDLQKVVSFSHSGWKTVILDEAHALSNQAFNALLKLLEDPKSKVTFILVTTHPHKIPDTVNSRLVPFRFSPLSPQDLLTVLERADSGLDAPVLDEIVKHSEGAARNALVLLERVLVLPDPTTQAVRELTGSYDTSTLFLSAFKADFDSFAEEVERATSTYLDLPRFVSFLMDDLTDLVRKRAIPRESFLKATTVLWSVRDLGDYSFQNKATLSASLFVLFDVLSSGTQIQSILEEEELLSPEEVQKLLGG